MYEKRGGGQKPQGTSPWKGWTEKRDLIGGGWYERQEEHPEEGVSTEKHLGRKGGATTLKAVKRLHKVRIVSPGFGDLYDVGKDGQFRAGEAGGQK